MNSLFQGRTSEKATPTGSKQGTPLPKTSGLRPQRPKLGQLNPKFLRTMTSLGSDLALDDMLLDKASEEEEKKKMELVPHQQMIKIN